MGVDVGVVAACVGVGVEEGDDGSSVAVRSAPAEHATSVSDSTVVATTAGALPPRNTQTTPQEVAIDGRFNRNDAHGAYSVASAEG
ncbi:MAG TPA: hypothetical protein VIQ02_05210 [Jiangellaceae bacterium]